MADPDNLRTASLYINNQLMSRGLLRDGHNINFAHPESGDGGLQATMGKVMSVINDLILRRDRDAENRESLSTTLRTLRADSQRQTTELTRQADRISDLQRKLDGADATERALRSQLKAAEHTAHKLKDDAAKSKTLLVQARASCATEVRKRDRQIDGLKKAVSDASRVRGGGRSRDVLSITVTGEIGGDERGGLPAGATEAEGYSLRLETNSFLTELARGLSEENEGLLALVKRTVDGLRDMSGLEHTTNGVEANSEHQSDAGGADVLILAPQKSAEELAGELEGILEHLRTILTNPSFVPIEEVEIREEAITRLRAGLETMESRWKDAVHMIDSWRKRMVSSGKTVDIDDLRMGLRLSPVKVRDVAETADVVPLSMRLSCVQEEEEEGEYDYDQYENEEQQNSPRGLSMVKEEDEQSPRRHRSPSPAESLHLVPAPGYEEENDDLDLDSSSIFQDDDDIDINELEQEEPNVQVLQESTYGASLDSPPLPIPPQLSPLKDSYSSGNKGPTMREPAYRKRPGDFTTIIEENTWDLMAEEEEKAPVPPPHVIKPQSPLQKKGTSASKGSPQWQDTRPGSTSSYDSPLFGKSGERPSQTDPSRKLFSKPTVNLVQQMQSKSQPEPGSTNGQGPFKSLRRPNSSRDSPDPLGAEIKRTNSDPVSPAPRQEPSSSSIRKAAPSAITLSPRPTSSSSLKSMANSIKEPQSPSIPRPRSPLRSNQPVNSRLPRPNSNANPPPQSPLTMATIAAKLAASEREADAARVRAKLRAVRSGGTRRNGGLLPPATITSNSNANGSPSERRAERLDRSSPKPRVKEEDREKESMDPVKRDREPPTPKSATRERVRQQKVEDDNAVDELAGSLGAAEQQQDVELGMKVTKRRRDRGERRTSKVASRRRSTLSPWELETLIQGTTN
ncbi:Afadin and alpha-actinin-binding-domain-containing protein [Annulohypoxylon maeteangense]|uniref:Afadin and alpha-actinin-binding-domain-containing protein n=1 Tax=Annulohypoxylon maeteangense TaxID=1927788 RepID=UPI00200779D1|nr:Afadin and alpha-actinin-binding-domain-containing protein [Annulohypoxylon maeteangense]KAI0881660.1 Afadin and alpha-actinin-binding-domain-containing protein [Annulohypoxylon maeteangense]